MIIDFTPQQIAERRRVSDFASGVLGPLAAQHDEQQAISKATIRRMAEARLFGTVLPEQWGGSGIDMIAYGLLHEEIGKICSSSRSLVTVHDMVAFVIYECGTTEQQRRWLPRLARGEILAAFAISEPNVGSDAKAVETTASPASGGYLVDGTKKWITAGQIADLFLVLCNTEGKSVALLVERNQPGVSIHSISGLLGTRGSMLAQIELTRCFVPIAMRLGRVGLGANIMLGSGLGLGRYSVAWGCVGILQACLEACVPYASSRRQFGSPLNRHELVQRMLTRMITDTRAARLLCCHAGYLKQSRSAEEVAATLICKYFSSTAAARASSDAVQIHGAAGCAEAAVTSRLYRDAKVMEIIEGSNEVQEIIISRLLCAISQTSRPESENTLPDKLETETTIC